MAAHRIPDEKRQAIRADIEAGNTRNDVARKHGVSSSTVTKVAKEFGLTFDRSATRAATEARRADLAARRAEVSAEFLRRAREALAQMDQPHLAFSFGGKDNTYNEKRLDSPPTGDKRNLMTIAGIGLQRHLDIERHDNDTGDSARSMLTELFAGIKAAVAAEAPPSDDGA